MTTFILYGLLAVGVVWMFRMHAGGHGGHGSQGGHGGHGGGCGMHGGGHRHESTEEFNHSGERDAASPVATHDHDHSRA